MRRRMMLRQSELPSGYRQLEYLESTGTQWIDTGVAPFGKKVILEVSIVESDNYYGLFGSRGINGITEKSYNIFTTKDKTIRIDWLKTGGNVSINYYEKLMIELFENGDVLVNNVQYRAIAEPSQTDYTMFIANLNNVGKPYINGGACARFYCVSVYDSWNLIRNFIPALDPSGRPCMYDTITKQPFYNLGTGEFLYEISSSGGY